MSRNRWFSGLALSLAALMPLTGCSTSPAPAPTTAPVAQDTAPAPAVASSAFSRSVTAFPTGDAATSVLLLERTAPSTVNVGVPFEYDVKVTNIARLPLEQVVVSDFCAAEFTLASSTPPATRADGSVLTWEIGRLLPGESKTIKVSGTAKSVGALMNCMTVSYDQRACVAINVVQPDLKLAVTSPAMVIRCDGIPVTYTVTNNGSGIAKNVTINHPLPAGVTSSDGRNVVTVAVGDLQPGQARAFKAQLMSGGKGTFEFKPTATAEGNLKSEASSSTKVMQPELAIAKTGPERIFLGRTATYDITVTNKGDGEARDTIVEDTLPGGVRVTAMTQGGAINGNKLTWNAGTLAPGASAKFSVTIEPTAISSLENTVMAQAYCASAVSAVTRTAVQGIPAVLLEVVDLTDPVEVGGTTVYEITATNQGSAVGTNIAITAMLEDSQQFVSAEGQTAGTAAGKTITFAPLPSLAPKAKATWRVTVKAASPADARFKVSMKTDQIERVVEETESTNLYK